MWKSALYGSMRPSPFSTHKYLKDSLNYRVLGNYGLMEPAKAIWEEVATFCEMSKES
jgi:hypothetical protein